MNRSTQDTAYYNHDHLWARRQHMVKPVWGPHSVRQYLGIVDSLAHRGEHSYSLLDVGCGAGAFGSMIADRPIRYTGVDESRVGIELGLSAYPSLELLHGDFIAGVPPEFCGRKFRVAAAVNVMHCIVEPEDRVAFLANCRSVVEKDGWLAVTSMCRPKSPSLRQADSPRAFHRVDEIVADVSAAGWTDIEPISFYTINHMSPVANVFLLARGGSAK